MVIIDKQNEKRKARRQALCDAIDRAQDEVEWIRTRLTALRALEIKAMSVLVDASNALRTFDNVPERKK